MGIVLTEEQRAAVENRGGSLLVSAAAGSGKTKVLVERLFRYILEEGCQVDDFLIITYTRAAAAELRGKIIAELNARLAQTPENHHLQKQLLRIYQADIKTVDAFCGSLLRERIDRLPLLDERYGLTADFRVLDNEELTLLRGRVLEQTLEVFYEELEEREGAKLLADTLGAGRDDRHLGDLVLTLHAKLQSHAAPDAWLAEQETVWRTGETKLYEDLLLAEMGRKLSAWQSILSQTAQELADGTEAEKYIPYVEELCAQLERFVRATEQGWRAAREASVSFGRMPSLRKGQADSAKERLTLRRDACKKAYQSIAEELQSSQEQLREDMAQTAPAMLALLRLTRDFTARFQREKLKRNGVDFSDQEHYALQMLTQADGTVTELGQTIAKRYREVLVDEFQDTNEVQNRIFDAVSDGGRKLFTVGDVKQSIYRFRLADPGIFLDRYRRYPDYRAAQEGEARKIRLTKNFRSRREVVEGTNFVFENVLSRAAGEMDYGEEEKLYFGAEYYLPRQDCAIEYHYLNLARQTGAMEERTERVEVEADFVARRIVQLLDSGFPVQDGEGFRPVRQEDIVILMRSPSARIAEYRKALEAHGLGCCAQMPEDFFSSIEIATVLGLLQIVDNPHQDIPLLAVLRSPLFGFTPDQLAELRMAAPKEDLYTALCTWEHPAAQRVQQLLSRLRQDAADMGVARFLWHCYHLCYVPELFGAMQGGARRREHLMELCQMAEQFERSGSRGIFDFVTYLTQLKDSGYAPEKPQSVGEGVRILSIHKSKGLEFPVVILADLSKSFHQEDFKEQVLVHPKLGLAPQRVDLSLQLRYDTVARTAVYQQLQAESRAEELRVLYVALTRPKEKLILVDTHVEGIKRLKECMALTSLPVLPEVVRSAKSLGEWILLPLLCRAESRPLWQLAGMEEPSFRTEGTPWQVFVHREGEDGLQDLREQGERSFPAQAGETLPFELRYPYPAAATLPAKLTATQLKGRERDEEIAEHSFVPPHLRSFAVPLFLRSEQSVTPARRGTVTHLLLQHIDWSVQTEEGIAQTIEHLREKGLLTAQEAEAIPCGEILRFLHSDLAQELRESELCQREYCFSVLVPASEYAEGVAEEDTVLLQGVVDCFYATGEGITVLDFKTDRVSGEEVFQRAESYRGQIEAYSRALEAVLERPVVRKVLYFLHCGRAIELGEGAKLGQNG